MDENDQVEGLCADILNYVTSEEGWEIEYIPGSWQDCLNRLEWNQINILPAIAYSDQRAEIFDFSEETIIMNWGLIYADKSIDLRTYLDLKGLKVGVLAGDIYYEGIRKICNSFNLDLDFVEFSSYSTIFEALETDKVDAGVFNRLYRTPDIQDAGIVETSLIFNPVEIRFAFSKGILYNKILSNKIDEHLKKLVADNNSIYYRSLDNFVRWQYKNPEPINWIFLAIIFFLTIGFFLFIVFNRYLNRQVQNRSIALRQSEDQYHSLYNMFRLSVDNVPDMIWAKNLKNEYMFANKALCNILLKARDTMEPIGRTDAYFGDKQRQLHPDDPDWYNVDQICAGSDEHILKNRKAHKFEESCYVNGEYLILDVHKAPFWDDM